MKLQYIFYIDAKVDYEVEELLEDTSNHTIRCLLKVEPGRPLRPVVTTLWL
jgi:hypothetical protein